ncbi:MAG: reverse transcriptase domain-containing protein, partial [Gammaproteobacteria bacterium]
MSPVLSNIYLHYVLDLWFEKRYAKSCRGKAYLIRYADDYVACFEQETDARRFRTEMEQRLAQFDLQVEPGKTAVLRFGSQALDQVRRREDEPRTFGFTHHVGRSRKGRFVVGRRTEGKRVQRKLKQLGERLRALRTEGGPAMVAYARRHLQGHIQY